MALIGIYSDVHISRNSSIIPLYLNENDKSNDYTTRLNMCIDSIKFALNKFKEYDVDLIVNCGDTFNSHTITSDELNAAIVAYKSHPIDLAKEFTIVGNHDKFNNAFNSSLFVNLFDDTQKCIQLYYYYAIDNNDLYFISYYDSNEFDDKLNEMLNEYPPREGCKAILFMHGDINGSYLSGNKRIENHISKDSLLKDFKIVINGHIHNHEVIYNSNGKEIINIGSLTTHSFADSNNHYGSCYILDTNTEELKVFKNPHQILFRSYEVNNEDDIEELSHTLDVDCNLKKIIKIKCPYDLKENVSEMLDFQDNILKYKLILNYNESNKPEESKNKDNGEFNINTNNSIKSSFESFLSENMDTLRNPINEYLDILNEL